MSNSRHIRTLLVALAAVFALSAVAVASASAAKPEFVICAKVAVAGTGAWNNKVCTEKDLSNEYIKVLPPWKKFAAGVWCAPVAEGESGRYKDEGCTEEAIPGGFVKVESAAANPLAFTSTSPTGYLENAKGEKIECKSDSNEGVITGPKTVTVTVKFKECKGPLGTTCTSTAPKAKNSGEIETNSLTGTLGYINAAAKEVGLSLKPTTGTLFTKFKCELIGIGEEIEVGEGTGKGGDSVIGTVTPVGSVSTTGELNYLCKSGSSGTQAIGSFEGGTTDVLESKKGSSGAWEKSCQNSPKDVITFAEPTEVEG